jgi:CheY-like chemotaxis protein
VVLGEFLESCGMIVRMAGSAVEAMHILDSEIPSLLLSDLGMPVEDGYSLIRKVRERSSETGGGICAIALTGYGGAADAERALAAGFHSVIVKPFNADRLLEQMRALLKRPL